jgi:hypothetical protein
VKIIEGCDFDAWDEAYVRYKKQMNAEY